MRLFVAVRLPADIVDVLGAMDRPSVAGVRWTAPEQWHVTLRFLGEVAEPSVDGVVATLSEAARQLSSAAAVVRERLGAFGPSVLHVPVDGLATWATAVGADDRAPFVGHVTVARGRRGPGVARGDVRSLVGRPLPDGPRTWRASAFELVRSHLDHAGARYETVATFAVGDHPHTNTRSQLR